MQSSRIQPASGAVTIGPDGGTWPLRLNFFFGVVTAAYLHFKRLDHAPSFIAAISAVNRNNHATFSACPNPQAIEIKGTDIPAHAL